MQQIFPANEKRVKLLTKALSFFCERLATIFKQLLRSRANVKIPLNRPLPQVDFQWFTLHG